MLRRALTAERRAWLLVATLLAQGCDWTPSREAHDRVWFERMLEGRYGRWLDTGEPLRDTFAGEDRMASMAEWARLTRHRLEVVTGRSWPFAGDWWLFGGLVGRADLPRGGAAELFLKEIVRSHWPKDTARFGHDYAFDVFLLVRPAQEARARLVRQWHVPPEDVALLLDPAVEAKLRHMFPPGEVERKLEQNKTMRVEGRLAVDPAGTVATVSVLGLTRPFEERVSLGEPSH